ncbi:MAG TPA: ribose 5-phosphate isomerase B [Cytophaga sp.]|jgi:ribose 5-phosphate isomerase B|nr:ribose 5-phosphate isomerase B [Cytophaga sp.]
MAYTIALGGDHAGYTYKKEIISYLESNGHKIIDCGPFSEASVDYPDFAHPVAEAVETGKATFGILICGSGNGVCMTANKHQNIRAGLCWTPEIAMLTRQHNNANVLCLPARFIPIEEAVACVKMFVETPFEGGRHEGRVNKIACL